MTNKPEKIDCFKAYDIRGRVPEELDEDLAYWIGQAWAARFKPRRLVVGRDIRLSGPALSRALIKGLTTAGVDILDLGLCGTEEIYFAAANLEVDGGVIITASHNPADYNGMKLVRKGARPISGDSGLRDIERLTAARQPLKAARPGSYKTINPRPDYIKHLLSYINPPELRPLTIVANCGNGCAGPILNILEQHLPFKFIKLQQQPDGNFPHGVPNPLLPENRAATAEAVIRQHADLGLAWDGDCDRCFFFDERGRFIEGYYIVGLLAQTLLNKNPGAKIIHDPRLTWNTVELVGQAGGEAVMSKTGHAFIKERMRQEDAVYGGEMSAHHYFRDFAYCDSGMIPWLIICELLSRSGRSLSSLIAPRLEAFPVSGEINSLVDDPEAAIARIKKHFTTGGRLDYTDGLSVEFTDYRFNIRKSNTEPLLRLNVESRHNKDLLREKTKALLKEIRQVKGEPMQAEKITINDNGTLNVPNQPIIPFIEGDGIGPDIWAAASKVLDAAVAKAYKGERQISWLETFAGDKAHAKTGEWMPNSTFDTIREYIVAIKGPLTTPVGEGIRSLNVTLRQELDLYACIRPVRYFQGVVSPVKEPEKVNMIIFRENTEDVYSGIEWPNDSPEAKKMIDFVATLGKKIRPESGIGIKPISPFCTKRLVRKAIEYAIKHNKPNVTLVHKGNIMKFTEGAFRNWGYELARDEFPKQCITEQELWDKYDGKRPEGKVVIQDRIADAMFQQILLRPAEYSVLALPNLTGDFISDALAAQVGGLGLAPGANISDQIALFEATHGTAPKYAGLDKVNPGSLLLSGVMMLEYLGWQEAGDLIQKALETTISNKTVTYDLARLMTGAHELKCSEFAQAIIDNM